MVPARRLVAMGALLASACGDAGSSVPEADGAPENLGLAARGLVGSGELWLVLAHEAEQGGRDRNGDGDALDALVSVLDLARGAPGPAHALGGGDVPPLLACDGAAAAFAVDEAAEGARDLNGDGDAEDRVLFVHARARGVTLAIGRAVSAIEAGGELVAVAIDERADGARDLDGDGDADGTALAVFDLRDESLTVLGLRDSWPLCVRDEFVVLRLAEREGLDLSLDGDDQDTAVLELYDGRTRLLQNTTLVLAGDAVACAGGTFGVSISEAGEGRGDLSGDGDADDAVFYVCAPERGLSVNLGVVVPLYPPPAVQGARYLLHAREAPGGVDANADGDREDLVVHVFDAESGVLTNTGLASQAAAALAGGWTGISVSEAMHGSVDLDGDGEAHGNVVHVLELASGRVRNLGLDAFVLRASATRLFLVPFEGEATVDWNGDGDRDDRVLLEWSAGDGRVRPGAAIGALLAVQGDHALVQVPERERGGDRNGDGDADDLVLELFDARSGSARTLPLAAGSVARLTPEGLVLALVDEEAQGRDLDGDGDRADEVLHVLRAR